MLLRLEGNEKTERKRGQERGKEKKERERGREKEKKNCDKTTQTDKGKTDV